MTRKLASIQRVISVTAIPGADKIETVGVLGWEVVTTKNEFKVGDLCVYYEIDSWLDSTDTRYATFEERFSNWGAKRGMRLKTIRLRKQLSQGLALNLSKFSELSGSVEGDDVTELLKIEKWESIEEQKANSGGANQERSKTKEFPSFIQKTDQERVQNYIANFGKLLPDETFEETIKLDGSSMTVFHMASNSPQFQSAIDEINYRLMRRMNFMSRLLFKAKIAIFSLVKVAPFIEGVCSRNIQLDIDGSNHFSAYVKENSILERLENMGRSIAIQGELLSPSIQNNYEKVDSYQYYVYDVYDIDTQSYLSPEQSLDIVYELGLSYVPVLNRSVSLKEICNGVDLQGKELVDAILARAEGPGMNPTVTREGVVYKSNQSKASFKAVSNSYLLSKK
jgi:RNA ligase (TIGR02306 family)